MRAFLARLWAARRAILFYAALIGAGAVSGHFLQDVVIPEMRPMNEPTIHRIIMSALVIFVLAAAIPFVPGAEIGFAMLLLFGGKAAPIVYGGMVCALVLSYGVARLVPLRALGTLVRWLGLKRIADLTRQIADTPVRDRGDLVFNKMNCRIGKSMMRNRYVVLALLLNLPGNSILGGGGGIAFMAGVSGLYGWWPYLLTVMLAVAPVPLVFSLIG